MKMFKKMKKGFTLVELIIVMVILGALAAIAIPKMSGSTDGAVIASVKSDLRTAIAKANEQYSKNLTYGNAVISNSTLGIIPSPDNSIVVTGVGDSFTVAVTRVNTATTCKGASLSYNSSTGEYKSGSTTSTSIPQINCTAS